MDHDLLPTQIAPHRDCGQAATGLPPAPSLSPSISISFKPATSTLLQYCSHFPLRNFKHILVTSCYTPFPSLPFHFFHQSFFSSLTSLLWGVLFTSHLPQSRAAVLGRALHPVWRWESSQREKTQHQSSSKPPRASQAPYKTHRVTRELRGMRCTSLSVRHPQKMETHNEVCLTRAQNTVFNLWESPHPRACSGHASTDSSDPEC